MPERKVSICPKCEKVKTSEGLGFVKEDEQAKETKKINQINDISKEEPCSNCFEASTES